MPGIEVVRRKIVLVQGFAWVPLRVLFPRYLLLLLGRCCARRTLNFLLALLLFCIRADKEENSRRSAGLTGAVLVCNGPPEVSINFGLF